MHSKLRLICGAVLAVAPLYLASAQAQVSTPFYSGKQVRIVISTGVGGGFAEYARALAMHLGNHLAGKPDFVVQSMPGAGGLLAANYLYTQAPQDGTTIGVVHTSVPMAPLFGAKGARFDTQKFHWLGSFDRADGPCLAWHTAPVKTWDDLLHTQFIVGSSGAGSPMDVYPAVLNKLFGTKIKVIGGYKDGSSIFLAMEREEIQGRCGPQSAIKSVHPTWIPQHLVTAPIVVAEKRNPDFPDTPAIIEFAKDEGTRQQLQLLFASQGFDRPVMLPPGAPTERVKDMREAFNATMTDPAFLADLDKMNLTHDWVRGEDVERTIAKAYAMPADVVAAAQETMSGK